MGWHRTGPQSSRDRPRPGEHLLPRPPLSGERRGIAGGITRDLARRLRRSGLEVGNLERIVHAGADHAATSAWRGRPELHLEGSTGAAAQSSRPRDTREARARDPLLRASLPCYCSIFANARQNRDGWTAALSSARIGRALTATSPTTFRSFPFRSRRRRGSRRSPPPRRRSPPRGSCPWDRRPDRRTSRHPHAGAGRRGR